MSGLDLMELLFELNTIFGDPTGLNDSIRRVVTTIAIFSFVFAAIQCFFGYKLFKIWVAIFGFFAFGILGGLVSATISGEVGMAIFIALLCAILGAFVAFKLYLVGVFILCGFMGFIIVAILTQSPELGIVMAIVLGVLGVLFDKPVIIISTSASGGLVAGSAAATFLGAPDSIGVLLGIAFIISGILVQFATNKNESSKSSSDREPLNQPTSAKDDAHHEDEVKSDDVHDGEVVQVEDSPDNELKGTMKTIEAKTSSAISFMKESAIKTSSDVSTIFKNKIEQDHLAFSKKAKGTTMDEVCENLEEVLYSNRISKNMMPFAEYILFAVVILMVMTSMIPTIVLLLAGALCLAKMRYGTLALAFSTVTVIMLWGLLKTIFITTQITTYSTELYAVSSFYVSNFIFTFIELLIFGYLTFESVRCYFKTEHGIALIYKYTNFLSTLKSIPNNSNVASNEIDTKVKCSNCGNLNAKNVRFCGSCGNKIEKTVTENDIIKSENNANM